MNDPLTPAYIAIGAARALDGARAEHPAGLLPSAVMDGFGGELGLVGDLIEDADWLDQMGYAEGDRLGLAVWAYDIAEEYGEAVVKALLAGEQADEQQRRAIAARLIEEWRE